MRGTWTARFSVRRKTGESKEPGHEEIFHKEVFFERVHVFLRGSSDDDVAYVARYLNQIDGKEWEGQEKPKILWMENPCCPVCGKIVDLDIKSCETGLNYCSHECARLHVKNITPKEGW